MPDLTPDFLAEILDARGPDFRRAVDAAVQQRIIRRALGACHGRLRDAARELGWSPRRLDYALTPALRDEAARLRAEAGVPGPRRGTQEVSTTQEGAPSRKPDPARVCADDSATATESDSATFAHPVARSDRKRTSKARTGRGAK